MYNFFYLGEKKYNPILKNPDKRIKKKEVKTTSFFNEYYETGQAENPTLLLICLDHFSDLDSWSET